MTLKNTHITTIGDGAAAWAAITTTKSPSSTPAYRKIMKCEENSLIHFSYFAQSTIKQLLASVKNLLSRSWNCELRRNRFFKLINSSIRRWLQGRNSPRESFNSQLHQHNPKLLMLNKNGYCAKNNENTVPSFTGDCGKWRSNNKPSERLLRPSRRQ